MVLKTPHQRFSAVPAAIGLYDPSQEKDACGLAMVATLRGSAGHDIIELALTALRNMEHRGAIGSDAGTGDGAGIMTQVPDAFLRAVAGVELPHAGRYVVGAAFLPTRAAERSQVKRQLEEYAGQERLRVLGWRPVPVRREQLGTLAREAMPAIEQVFLVPENPELSGIALDRLAFRLRKRAERERVLPLAVLPHARVQGHGHDAAARTVLPRPLR